jgi:hypothetical protein
VSSMSSMLKNSWGSFLLGGTLIQHCVDFLWTSCRTPRSPMDRQNNVLLHWDTPHVTHLSSTSFSFPSLASHADSGPHSSTPLRSHGCLGLHNSSSTFHASHAPAVASVFLYILQTHANSWPESWTLQPLLFPPWSPSASAHTVPLPNCSPHLGHPFNPMSFDASASTQIHSHNSMSSHLDKNDLLHHFFPLSFPCPQLSARSVELPTPCWACRLLGLHASLHILPSCSGLFGIHCTHSSLYPPISTPPPHVCMPLLPHTWPLPLWDPTDTPSLATVLVQ